MGAVWDQTVQVLAGRGVTIARVALLTVFVPVVLAAVLPLVLGTGVVAKPTTMVIGVALRVVLLFGLLAITALASDPLTGERSAYGIARAALLPAIGAVLLIGLILFGLMIPGAALMVASGIDLEAAKADLPQPTLSPGPLLGSAAYFFAYAIFALWLAARLAPMLAVLVNERRGVGALTLTFKLTNRLALRIIGVLILFLLVTAVAELAAKWVFGTVFRLLLGPERETLVAVLGLLPVVAVLTASSTLVCVFAARLHAAIRAAREGPAPVA